MSFVKFRVFGDFNAKVSPAAVDRKSAASKPNIHKDTEKTNGDPEDLQVLQGRVGYSEPKGRKVPEGTQYPSRVHQRWRRRDSEGSYQIAPEDLGNQDIIEGVDRVFTGGPSQAGERPPLLA